MSSSPLSRTQELPSLDELRQRALSMEAGRAEVDALLLGLSQPLRPGESARARADVLHRIIDDPWLGGFTGSDGRRVDAVAAQALVDLGPPYAEELSPDGRKALEGALTASDGFVIYDDPPAVVVSTRQQVGLWLAVVMGVLELLIVITGNGSALLLGAVFITVTSFVPVFVATSERGIRNRVVHHVCLVFTALASLPWLFVAAFLFWFNGYMHSERTLHYLLPLIPALLRLSIPFLLHGRAPASPSSEEAE